MVSEISGSCAVVSVVVMLAVLEMMDPSGFVSSAVMVVAPAFLPVTSPAELTVAMVELLELHAIWAELVTSVCSPAVPLVASAINWLVCPVAEMSTEDGKRVKAVYFSVVPPVTVKVAVPTTVPPVALA
jgi:hypothetical protein